MEQKKAYGMGEEGRGQVRRRKDALLDDAQAPQHEARLPNRGLAEALGQAHHDNQRVASLQRAALRLDERPVVAHPLVAAHPVHHGTARVLIATLPHLLK